MLKLSIIVPVYKVEHYLERCIKSILNQTFNEFELILIDDGSPDRCGKICDDYAQRDERVIVLHQKNNGVSAARNAGLDIAKGKYVGFVDSDDFIDPHMYQMMVDVAEEKNVDMVACGVKHCNENETFLFEELLSEGFYSQKEMLKALYMMPNPIGGCVWNKIVRFEKIKDIRYREGIAMAEDRLYLFDYFCQCSNGYKISNPLYWVTERADSATHLPNIYAKCELLESSKKLMELANEHSFLLGKIATEKYLDDCVRNIPEIRRLGEKTSQPYKKEWIKSQIVMLIVIILGSIRKKLPKHKMNGFLYEWVRNWKR